MVQPWQPLREHPMRGWGTGYREAVNSTQVKVPEVKTDPRQPNTGVETDLRQPKTGVKTDPRQPKYGKKTYPKLPNLLSKVQDPAPTAVISVPSITKC